MQDKALDSRKLVGQGYDGAATFSGVHLGVQRSMLLALFSYIVPAIDYN